MCNFPIQTDKTLEHNGPDITVIDKKRKKCLLIDSTWLFDTRIEKKEKENCTNYTALKYKTAIIWKTRKVGVIVVLGPVAKHFQKKFEKLDLDFTIEALFTLNDKNNMDSVVYFYTNKKKNDDTVSKTTGCLLYAIVAFSAGYGIIPESKRKNNLVNLIY